MSVTVAYLAAMESADGCPHGQVAVRRGVGLCAKMLVRARNEGRAWLPWEVVYSQVRERGAARGCRIECFDALQATFGPGVAHKGLSGCG